MAFFIPLLKAERGDGSCVDGLVSVDLLEPPALASFSPSVFVLGLVADSLCSMGTDSFGLSTCLPGLGACSAFLTPAPISC